MEEQTPELFDNVEENSKSDEFTSFETENSEEEDELEIPAFLRRQKINGLQKINECHHKTGKPFSSNVKRIS